MRHTRWLVTAGIAVLALGTVSCSRTPRLDGAQIDIPVFTSSSLDDEHTATTSDDFHDIGKFATHSWELSTAADWKTVDAFYRERLPSAERDDEDSPVDDDQSPLEHEVRFLWTPAGWTGGAKVMVLIQKEPRDGKTCYEITQDVLKH